MLVNKEGCDSTVYENVDKLSPEHSQRFLCYLGMALHCAQSHKLRWKSLESGDLFVSMCDNDCHTHFEVTFRERPGAFTTDGLVVTLCATLWDKAAVGREYENGVEFTTAGYTMRVLTDAESC